MIKYIIEVVLYPLSTQLKSDRKQQLASCLVSDAILKVGVVVNTTDRKRIKYISKIVINNLFKVIRAAQLSC